MEKTNISKGLASKLFKAMSKISPLIKDSKGYGYKYSSIKSIHEFLKPILVECGLFITHRTISKSEALESLVTSAVDSETGESLSTQAEILSIHFLYQMYKSEMVKYESDQNSGIKKKAPRNPIQSYGSQVTYVRRYNIVNLFNLVSEDNDGFDISNYDPRAYGN